MVDSVNRGAPEQMDAIIQTPKPGPILTIEPNMGTVTEAMKPAVDAAQKTMNAMDMGHPPEIFFRPQDPQKVIEHTGDNPRKVYTEKVWENTERELDWADGRKYTEKLDGKGGRFNTMRAPDPYENFDEHMTPTGPGSAKVTRTGPNPENNYSTTQTLNSYNKTWKDGRTLDVNLTTDGHVLSTYKGFGNTDSFTSTQDPDGTMRLDYKNSSGYIRYPDGRTHEW